MPLGLVAAGVAFLGLALLGGAALGVWLWSEAKPESLANVSQTENTPAIPPPKAKVEEKRPPAPVETDATKGGSAVRPPRTERDDAIGNKEAELPAPANAKMHDVDSAKKETGFPVPAKTKQDDVNSAKKDADVPPPTKASADKKKKGPAAKMTGQEVYDRVLKSTVWVNNPGTGSGTGVLIDTAKGLVLTNYHVVFHRGNIPPDEILKVIDDKLAQGDALTQESKQFKAYDYQFFKANEYQIDMVSREVDAYLRLVDSAGRLIASDDDSGGDTNARIRFKPTQDGRYHIIATTCTGGTGSFKLTISKSVARKGAEKAGPSVAPFVMVNAPDFVAGQVIATKSHYLKLNALNPEPFKAKVVAVSETKDLAILKVNFLPPYCAHLPLAKNSSKPGQTVHSIGNPGASGAMWVYTSGTVRTAPYQRQWKSSGAGMSMSLDAVVIETQSPTNNGDSGGPLVNDSGELVALTQGVTVGANSINLFIDVVEIRSFLKSNGVRWLEQ